MTYQFRYMSEPRTWYPVVCLRRNVGAIVLIYKYRPTPNGRWFYKAETLTNDEAKRRVRHDPRRRSINRDLHA